MEPEQPLVLIFNDDNCFSFYLLFILWQLKPTFSLGEHSVKKFAEQILRLGSEKFPEFSAYGKFTFFLPVDSSFQVLITHRF